MKTGGWLVVGSIVVMLGSGCDGDRASPRPDSIASSHLEAGASSSTLALLPVSQELMRDCASAAQLLGFVIACPTVLPDDSVEESDAECTSAMHQRPRGVPCVFGRRFALDVGGAPGHLVIVASGGKGLTECYGKLVGRTKVGTEIAKRILCPEGSGQHSGHVMLRWRRAGIRYVVSLHGHSDLNWSYIENVAEHLTYIRP